MIYKAYRAISGLLGKTKLRESKWLWQINNSIRKTLKPSYVMMGDRKFYLDPLDSHNLALNPVHEPESTAKVLEKVKKDYLCVDVGASIGYYTRLFSELTGNEGRVYSFEPSYETYFTLLKNCGHLENVYFFHYAVSDKHAVIEFYTSVDSTTDSMFLDNSRKHQQKEMVHSVPLDTLLRTADFIKIDVEGAELMVLKGATNILDNSNPKLLIECTPKTAPDLFNFLEGRGYQSEILDWRNGFCNLYCER